MNLVRSVMSLFLLLLVAVAIAGWVWAGSQPTAVLWGARAVLGLCMVAGLAGVARLWSEKPAVADGSKEVHGAT